VGHFPGATAGQFQGRVADYGRAVVETEWQRMKAGNDSPFATAAFENLVRTYFSIDPANEQQQSMLTLGNLFMAQPAPTGSTTTFPRTLQPSPGYP
jgi:hypothetical protein